MKKGSQILFYILIFLLFLSMFRLFSEPRSEEIPYSTFKTLLAAEKSEGPRRSRGIRSRACS